MPLRWLCRILLVGLFALTAQGEDAPAPDILHSGWPRCFFFRKAEGFGSQIGKQFDYTRWDRAFSRLQGIIGKTLDEEIPGRSVNIPHFTRFKQAHPGQLVLLHYNGNARDPRDNHGRFFDGHWIYRVGCRVQHPVRAEAGQVTFRVENSRLFLTGVGRFHDRNDDLGLCRLDTDGRPDWSVAEQLELVSVDHQAGTVTVKRGCFGTSPLALKDGQAYLAAHAHEGPWGQTNHLLWYYNYSTECPRDGAGQQAADILVDDLAERLGTEGPLGTYDGLEFDVLHNEHGSPAPFRARDYDMNADGQPDNGWFNRINTYGVGVVHFCRKLRDRLGEHRLILADGGTVRAQRAVPYLNGIESEGWPHLSDWAIEDWSGGMNRHLYWTRFARPPAFTYINHKYITRTGDLPGHHGQPDVASSIHRLVFGVACCTDSAVTYAYSPPDSQGMQLGLWDELVGGDLQQPGWLGAPTGPTRRLALEQTPLFQVQGPALQARMSPDTTTADIQVDGGSVVVRSRENATSGLAIRLDGLPTDGPDLVVRLRARCATPTGYPAGVPNLAWITIVPDKFQLVRPDPPRARMQLRGKAIQAMDTSTGASVHFQEVRTLDGESHSAYACHPPYQGGVRGRSIWERDVVIPPGSQLVFHTGLSPLAAERSDGVTFIVEALVADGEVLPLFREHITNWRWKRHERSLEALAGKTVTLRFSTDCGPDDHTTTDQAAWGDVALTVPGHVPTPPVKAMALLGPGSVEAVAYFKAVRSPTIDLEVRAEGPGPLVIEDLSLHAYPDVLLRPYQHGLVLVNPSPRPHHFDLATLASGSYRRLQGSPKQDPRVNNSQAVGSSVTLGPKDGLFLRTQASPRRPD